MKEMIKSGTKGSQGEILLSQIKKLITDRNGIVKISTLVILSGYSARYINYLFEMYSGISAKQFCNSVRMECVLNEFYNNPDVSFSCIARKFHFYDQAHFVHEFKKSTGKTPSQYLDEVIKSSKVPVSA